MFQYLCLYFSFFHHPKNTGGSGNLPHCRLLIYSLFFFFRLGNNQCTNLLMTFKSHFQMVTRPKIQKNIVIPSMVPLIEASINIFNVSIAYTSLKIRNHHRHQLQNHPLLWTCRQEVLHRQSSADC